MYLKLDRMIVRNYRNSVAIRYLKQFLTLAKSPCSIFNCIDTDSHVYLLLCIVTMD